MKRDIALIYRGKPSARRFFLLLERLERGLRILSADERRPAAAGPAEPWRRPCERGRVLLSHLLNEPCWVSDALAGKVAGRWRRIWRSLRLDHLAGFRSDLIAPPEPVEVVEDDLERLGVVREVRHHAEHTKRVYWVEDALYALCLLEVTSDKEVKKQVVGRPLGVRLLARKLGLIARLDLFELQMLCLQLRLSLKASGLCFGVCERCEGAGGGYQELLPVRGRVSIRRHIARRSAKTALRYASNCAARL